MEKVIASIFSYGIFAVGFIVMLVYFMRKLETVFTALFADLQQDDAAVKESYRKRLKAANRQERIQTQKMRAVLQEQEEREAILYEELENLLATAKKYEEKIKQLEQIKNEKVIEIPVLPTAPNTLSKPLKNYFQQILSDVFIETEEEERALYAEAIREFDMVVQTEKVRCALPYKVILRLFEIYDDQQLTDFAASFQVFHERAKKLAVKQIYQSSYFSPEQKLKVMREENVLDELDLNFVEFLFYMLTHFSYRQVKSLFQHFERVYNIHFYTGNIQVTVANEADKQVFASIWDESHTHYRTVYCLKKEQLGGVILHFDNKSIDMSYRYLIEQATENIEAEVKI